MEKTQAECTAYLNKPGENFYLQLQQVAIEFARNCTLPDVFHAAGKFILLPDTVTAANETKTDPVAKTTTVKSVFSNTIKALLKSPTTTQTQIIDALLSQLHKDLQLQPVVFLMLSQDNVKLSDSMGKGITTDSEFKKMVIETKNSGLLKSLMGKPQALWIDPDKYQKYETLLPAAVKSGMTSRNLFLMSLFINNRVRGVIIAASHDSNPVNCKKSYLEFRSAIQLTSKALDYLTKRQHRSAA